MVYTNEKNKGITLVALIITIIILLILAGIAISQLTENGILEKTKQAKGKYQNAQNLENSILDNYEKEIDSARDTVTIDKDEYQKLKQKGSWVLLASSTSTTEDSKEVQNLSQFSTIVVLNYAGNKQITNTANASYEVFKGLDSLSSRFAKSDGSLVYVTAKYVDDTHVKISQSKGYKIELYGIY